MDAPEHHARDKHPHEHGSPAKHDTLDEFARLLVQEELAVTRPETFFNLIPTVLKEYQGSTPVEARDGPGYWQDRNMRGHVFEVYVTNLILAVAEVMPGVDHVVPLWEPGGDAGRKNHPPAAGFGKDKYGSPCLFHSGIPVMEIDGLVSIDGKMHVIEMKQEMNPLNDDVVDLLERRQRVEAITGKECGIIVITASESKVRRYKVEARHNELFTMVVLGRFEMFWQWLQDKDVTALLPSPERLPCKKVRHPREVLPTRVDFVSTVKQVSSLFFNPSITRDAFWHQAFEPFWIAGKFPVGVIDAAMLEPVLCAMSQDPKGLEEHVERGTRGVAYLRVMNDRGVMPEVYLDTKGKHKVKWKFNPATANFIRPKRINPRSYYFHEVRRFTKAAKGLLLDKHRWEFILARCRQLSTDGDPWVIELHAAIDAINSRPATHRAPPVKHGPKKRKPGQRPDTPSSPGGHSASEAPQHKRPRRSPKQRRAPGPGGKPPSHEQAGR